MVNSLAGRAFFICAALFVYDVSLLDVAEAQAGASTGVSAVASPAAAAAIPFASCAPVIAKSCQVNEADGKPLSEAREIFGCLRKHETELPLECKTEIERFIQAGRQAAARGGGALGSFGGLNPLSPPIPIFNFEGRISPEAEHRSDNRVSLSSPVYGSESGLLSASLSAAETHFGDEITLTSGIRVRDLYRAEVGLQYSRRLENKRTFGLRGSIGSTGDQLFQSSNDMSFSVNASYGFPGSGKDYWVLLAFIANNSPIGNYIPLPGLIYIHRTDTFTGIIGFPIISLQWTPTTQWSYSVSVFGPILTAEVSNGEVDKTQLFAQAGFSQQTFILHDRARDRDRLTLQEKKVSVGIRKPLFLSSYGEFQIGRAFDRSMYVGEKLLKTDGGLADLPNALYLTASLKHVF